MARALNAKVFMRPWIVVAFVAALTACRGEPVPRDYQNAPPAMTHPAAKKSDAPANGMADATPEPNSGVEGTATPPPPSTTLKDTAPATTTTVTTTT